MFAADAGYFHGLVVTVASLLVSLRIRGEWHLSVLDGGLTATQRLYLENMTSMLNSAAAIYFIPYQKDTFAQLPAIRNQSHMTYARLASPHLISVEQFLYLDSDLLVMNDLAENPLLPLSGSICSGVIDPTYQVLGNDQCGVALDREQSGLPYLNAGLLGIDRGKWLEADVTNRCVRFLEKYSGARAWDQSAINHVTCGANMVIADKQWNQNITRFSNQIIRKTGPEQTFHFIGKSKPWFPGSPPPETASAHAIYHAFVHYLFRDCPVPPVNTTDLELLQRKVRRKVVLYGMSFQGKKIEQWRNCEVTPAEVSDLAERTKFLLGDTVSKHSLVWPA